MAQRRIVILGGGSAGWMSAAYLSARLPDAVVSLVESPAVPTVGVGEATVPSLRSFLAELGADEPSFMRSADATFKLAIRFEGWTGWRDPDTFWHPFGTLPRAGEHRLDALWSGFAAELGLPPFDQACFEATALCLEQRAPLAAPGGQKVGADLDYAYHVDATRLVELLRELAIGRGVRAYVEHVERVERAEDGRIRALVTREQRHEADLFVDCSGFRRLLIGETLGVAFESFADDLFCDRALVASTVSSPRSILPYTTSTAMAAGWLWRIPLWSRDSWGYVYSSRHISADQAAQEVAARLPMQAELREIVMDPGCMSSFFHHNCAAVGLAAGFVEPLESTGLWLVELGLRHLVEHIDAPERYDHAMRSIYDELRAFLVAHYYSSRRRDTPFWRANTVERTQLPATLQTRLQSPERSSLDPQNYSWSLILSGHRGPPPAPEQRPDVPAAEVLKAFADVRTGAARALGLAPSHDTFLAALHGKSRS